MMAIFRWKRSRLGRLRRGDAAVIHVVGEGDFGLFRSLGRGAGLLSVPTATPRTIASANTNFQPPPMFPRAASPTRR